MSKKQIMEQCADENTANNMLLSKNIAISLNSHHSKRNSNVLILGSAGSGKGYNYTIPNILNAGYSFVVTDTSGSIYEQIHTVLEEKGYNIQILDIQHFNKSMHYNPLALLQQQYTDDYVRYEISRAKLINIIMTSNNKENSGDFLYESTKSAILRFAINYLMYVNSDKKESTFADLVDILNRIAALISDQNEYEDIEKELGLSNESSKEKEICKNLRNFLTIERKSKQAALTSCIIMLNPFIISQAADILKKDNNDSNNIDFEKLNKEKSALFIMTTPIDYTFTSIAIMLISQLAGYCITERSTVTDIEYPHIQFYIDDFPFYIEGIGTLMATIRKYNIGISLYAQSISQLKVLYKHNYDLVVSNCDSILYLHAGLDAATAEYLTNKFGKQISIDSMTDEDCIVGIRGFEPVIDKKVKI